MSAISSVLVDIASLFAVACKTQRLVMAAMLVRWYHTASSLCGESNVARITFTSVAGATGRDAAPICAVNQERVVLPGSLTEQSAYKHPKKNYSSKNNEVMKYLCDVAF